MFFLKALLLFRILKPQVHLVNRSPKVKTPRIFLIHMDSITSLVWKLFVYLGLLRNLITLFKMSGLTYANHGSLLTVGNFVAPNSDGQLLRAGGRDDTYSVDYNFQQKVKTQYEMAIRYYLNRSFVSSWKIVYPLIRQIMTLSAKDRAAQSSASLDKLLTIKCFKLYMTLVDLLLKSLNPESSQPRTDFDSYVNDEDGQIEAEAIRHQFMHGTLLKQVMQIYNGIIADVDAELFLMCCVIEFSNGFPLQQLRSQLEKYLVAVKILHGTDYETFEALKDARKENVLKFYLMQVMVKTENVHESRDLICRIFVTDEGRLKEYMALFDSAVKKSKEDAKTAVKVANATETAASSKQKYTSSSQQEKAPVERNELINLTSKSTREKHGSELEKRTSQIRATHFLRQFPTYRTFKECVIKGWRLLQCQPMSSTLRLSGFIIFVLTFLLSISRANGKQRIRRMISWLIKHLKDTLSMAFKVTYV